MKKFLSVAVFMYLVAIAPAYSAEKNSTFEQIRQSGEIRCGYNVYSPYLRRDPNSGELSGIFFDIMAAIGKNAGLKIIWAEEAGRADIFTGLDNGRYDVWCSGIWPNATRALAGRFTTPAFYSVVTPWVRQNDDKIKSIADIRAGKARITAVDGAMEAIIAENDFPDNPRLTMPQSTPFDTNFQNIITEKADVTFAEPSSVAEFLTNNPGVLKSLGADHSLRTFANTLAVQQDDVRTQEFLNNAMNEIVYSGEVDKILMKYELVPGSFLRVARPYQ